jgi:hypothetical protein
MTYMSFAFLLILVTASSLTNAQLSVTKSERGQTENRIHLAIIGDGYTEQDIRDLYIPKVDSTLEYMFNNPTKVVPYPRYRNFINVYRIDIVSQDSGVDELSSNNYRNTALGGEDGCTNYLIGVCGANWLLVHDAFEDAASMNGFNPDWYWVLLNNTKYNAGAHYPARGALPIYSAHYEGHWDMRDIALHEGAHAWHDLADEYGGNANYTGGEIGQVNVTNDSSGAKWQRWLGFEMPSGLEMGVFEGARYHDTGLYRPSRSSKMNGGPDDCHYLGNYCAHNMVGIEKIILDIYDIVTPIDRHFDNTQTLIGPQQLWIETIDPEVLMVDWLVDGVVVQRKGAEQFEVSDYLNEHGTYTVTARAWDEVIEHAFSDNSYPHPLDMVRKDLDKLEQSVEWKVVIEQIQLPPTPVLTPVAIQPATTPVLVPASGSGGGSVGGVFTLVLILLAGIKGVRVNLE